MQQKDGRPNAGIKLPEPTESDPEILQSPVARSGFSNNAASQEGLSLTPPTCSLSNGKYIDIEPEVWNMPQFRQSMPTVDGVLDSLVYLNDSQLEEWPGLEFQPLDDMKLWFTPEYPNICLLEQPFMSPMSDWQLSEEHAL